MYRPSHRVANVPTAQEVNNSKLKPNLSTSSPLKFESPVLLNEKWFEMAAQIKYRNFITAYFSFRLYSYLSINNTNPNKHINYAFHTKCRKFDFKYNYSIQHHY